MEHHGWIGWFEKQKVSCNRQYNWIDVCESVEREAPQSRMNVNFNEFQV